MRLDPLQPLWFKAFVSSWQHALAQVRVHGVSMSPRRWDGVRERCGGVVAGDLLTSGRSEWVCVRVHMSCWPPGTVERAVWCLRWCVHKGSSGRACTTARHRGLQNPEFSGQGHKETQ